MALRAEAHGYRHYVGSSVKGEAAIGGLDRQARRKLLAEIVADVGRLSELARQTRGELPADSAQQQTMLDGRSCWVNCCSTTTSALATETTMLLTLMVGGP